MRPTLWGGYTKQGERAYHSDQWLTPSSPNYCIMEKNKREEEGLHALGKKTQYRMDYAPEVLETFENKHPDNDYWVRFNIPGQRMVESKSLKLYLFSFRNHGDFHEDCVNIIMKDLIRLMQPKYIEVTGLFTPRGGISIWPYANYGQPGTKYEQLAERRLMSHE